MSKSKLVKVYKIYRLANIEEYKVTTLVARDQYKEYVSEEEAMGVIDSLGSWNEYTILPIIKRVHEWD